MACNKFFRISKTNFALFPSPTCLSSTQVIPKSFIKEVPSVQLHHFSTHKTYSTLFSSKQTYHRRCKLYSVTNHRSSVAFMSTNLESDKFHVVVTNPLQESTTSDLAFQSTNVLSTVNSSQPVATLADASNTFILDTAASLSSDIQVATQLAEPALSSLGLCNYTPVGAVQMFLEYLHIGWDMPWWIAIAASTVAARILLLPILVKTQKSTIEMSNNMPQLQYLQTKFGEARKSGNAIEASRLSTEIMMYMKEKNINPIKTAMMPMIQAPVFISFFLALRSMAKLPVESLKTGGIWWVTDLTIPDPYYILPLVSCGTLYIVLKVGAESGVKMQDLRMAKYVLQALPVIALPFCINFPAAVLYYWVTTNFCTLGIVYLLKLKPIRKALKLPSPRPIDPKFTLPKKGFVKGIKDAYEDQKVLGSINERRRIDEIRFKKAGTGPVPRTYSYDPTKPRPSNVAISAKQHKP